MARDSVGASGATQAAARSEAGAVTLELALHGPDPATETLDDLYRALSAAGAARVERVYLTAPESDQRVADLVEVTTLLVGATGNVVAIVETVRAWLARRRDAAAHGPTASAAEASTPRVIVTLDGETLELVDPPERAMNEAIARFYDRHRQD
ncbi:hypothetical protein AB0H86_41330 [Streptomyces sp. NPDC050997]|uniref:hypothetical protein n=1 Tax=Streptomyces sp. NPDC050997 TaxID=3155519 RepID=UPI003416FB7B